jgi:hypothetical protein
MQPARTYVVECYVPGVDDAAVRSAADGVAAQVRGMRPEADAVEYLGALLMAVDEVVLHAFRAADPELVRRISTAAGLAFERIVESVEVLPAPLIQSTAHERREP